jgi:hypothetical protein
VEAVVKVLKRKEVTDIMNVFKDVNVYENINSARFNTVETCVAMEMENNKLGFTHLRLLCSKKNFILEMCAKVGNDFYLSSQLCKSMFIGISKVTSIVHGPCLSDKDGLFDFAFSLHSRQWISIANQWVTRCNHSWPSSDVKSHIINHGVLFCPC